MSEPMYQWVIYDHPLDYPDYFVARKWKILDGKVEPLVDALILHKELDEIREIFYNQGLLRISRFAEDDPCIIEVWI
jgi:hypothetical protein